MFDGTEVLYLRKKYLISTDGKKKVKRILSCIFGARQKDCLRGLHLCCVLLRSRNTLSTEKL